MRRYTFIILFALLTILVAACTDDPPSDIRGCIAEEGQAADEIYDRDEGCHNGNIMHAEVDHGEDAEGEEHEESEDDADHEEGEEDHEKEAEDAESDEEE